MGHRKLGTSTRLLLAAGLLGILCGPMPAAAQGQVERLIEAELLRTDTLLDRAQEEVAGVRNAFAHDRLGQARQAQREAWGAFGHADAAGLRSAHLLTKRAQDLALKAIEAAAVEKRARETVRALIEQARDRATAVEPLVATSGDPLAEQLFEQGLAQLTRAQRAFQRSEPKAARLATLARSLIERAARAAAGEVADAGVLEATLERTEALINEVRVRLSEERPPPAAAAALEEAAGLLDQAQRALRGGRRLRAFRLGMAAREKALHVLTRLQRLPAVGELRATLQDLEGLYEDLAPRIAASGNRRAESLFDQGRKMLAEVRRALRDGRAREALTALVAAETLLRETSEALGEG